MRCRIIKRLVSRSEGRHSPVFSEHPKTLAEPLVADACAAGIKEVLDSEGFYVGPPVGVSMWPMLRNRRDAILVVPAPERLKRYDVALYRRGQMMVLHRVLGLYENGYVICGDNCIALERVPFNQVFGVLKGFYRDDRYVDCGMSRSYRAYSRLWVALGPVRRASRRAWGLVKRAGKRILLGRRGAGECA